MDTKFLTTIESYFDSTQVATIENLIKEITLKYPDTSKKMLNFACGVSEILISINTDFPTVLATFAYACQIYQISMEHSSLSHHEVKSILKGLDKIDAITINQNDQEYNGLREMFIALAKDIRVIFLKLAIESYKVSHPEVYSNTEEMDTDFHYANDIYAPLAAMLGVSKLKNILEDRVFHYFKPNAYQQLYETLNKDKASRDEQLALTIKRIEQEVVQGINNVKVFGRQKQLSSIYKKIQSKTHELSKVLDLLAVRILVNTIEECYYVLGKVHGIYAPIDHFKDYISNPKENGYQSIHTTVIVENGDPLEIQIRTHDMNLYAEYGVAAHWAYKQKRSASTESDKKINYIRSIMDMHKDKSDEELREALKVDIYSGDVFVQTPQGKVIKLPEGSTTIDFAYAIHSAVGDHCMGAKINGKMCPISTVLQNGDMVEIILNPNSKGPSRDWLKIVKTNNAKHRIRTFFKKEMKEENIKKGKSILEASAKAKNILLSNYMKDEYLNDVFDRYALANIDEMYAALGSGTLSTNQVIGKLLNLASQNEVKNVPIKPITTKQNTEENDQVMVHGFKGIMTKFAHCCTPVPGDDIVGYISRGKGITIHRDNCSTLKSYEPERLIPCTWNTNQNTQSFVASFIVYCMNMSGTLSAITKKISDQKINIVSLYTKVQDDVSSVHCSVQIKSKEDLSYLISKIKTLDFVTDVVRS